jgi:hypothetical protein
MWDGHITIIHIKNKNNVHNISHCFIIHL